MTKAKELMNGLRGRGETGWAAYLQSLEERQEQLAENKMRQYTIEGKSFTLNESMGAALAELLEFVAKIIQEESQEFSNSYRESANSLRKELAKQNSFDQQELKTRANDAELTAKNIEAFAARVLRRIQNMIDDLKQR